MNRIEKKFRQLEPQNKKAFIAFITAGYPSLRVTEKLIPELEKAGVDIIELGVPFSDPMADGPMIQEASQRALEKGTHLEDILKMVKRLRRHTQVPLCLMSYYNPIFCFGRKRFAESAARSGVDGLIIPDLPPEEDREFVKIVKRSGIDLICFISPTTSIKRAKFISGVSRGFIYYISLTGVTGARNRLPAGLIRHLRSIKRITNKPVCVGFGVSRREQIKQLYKAADGVIVGSAIIRKIKDNLGRKDMLKRVSAFVKGLKNV